MLRERSTSWSRAATSVCLALFLFDAPASAADGPAGSVVLLDFEDDSQFARLRSRDFTKVEPSLEAHEGKRGARIEYSAVPEGTRDYPAVIIDGDGLKVRNLTSFEAISLWVLNPGPDDAELSLAIWDKGGNRGFPTPSTFTVKPGRWQQIVARLVLHGLDARQIASIHFYQKVNRRPVVLVIDDVQLLSPEAGRTAAQVQQVRERLKAARANADALGAREHIEPKIATLARRLDALEGPGGAGRTQRRLELAQIVRESQELSGAIQIRNNGTNIVLSGNQVDARWLSNSAKVSDINVLFLRNTGLRDPDFTALASAQNLQVLIIDGKTITGTGLQQLPSDRLRSLGMNDTGAHDESMQHVGRFGRLVDLQLGNTSVTSGVLKHLRVLSHLKVLILDDTRVSDAGFVEISGLTSLETLRLPRTRITGESLRHLAGLSRLKNLDLSHTKIDDAGLSHLGELRQLESLGLEGTPIVGAGFEKLGALDKLGSLSLSNTRVGDSALKHLKLPRLKRLELSSTRITDATLQHVLQSARLEYLDLYGTNVTDAGLAHLKSQRGLQELYLGGTQTSDAGVAHFNQLNQLQQLDLEGTQITDDALLHLKGLTNLAALKLGKTRITGVGLAHLAALAKLGYLDLSGTGVTDEALIHVARLPNLRTLVLNGTRVSNKGMLHLRAARRLTELHLEATGVGDEGVEMLTPLPNLQELNLSETAVTDEGLRHLKSITKLLSVNLNHTRITDAGLAHLGDGFIALELSHTRITDQGVDHILRDGRLMHLRLASTGITNDTLKLLHATPGLRLLDVAETRIDDAALQHLAFLPELQELNLNGTAISDRGIESLLKMTGLQRVSLENSRVTAQGASYLKHRAPDLKLTLDVPWVWGERWSHSDLERSESSVLLQQLKELTSLGSLRLDGPLLRPEVLRSLKDLSTLEHLSFRGAALTDDLLAELLGLSQVVRLDLSETRVTDRGLAHLKDMQNLRELNLEGTRVTGSGLADLTALTRLQVLNLQRTPLADDGLMHVAGMNELRHLELSSTRVTDAGIDHLTALPRLQYLDLYGTAVTETGAARLSRMSSLRYCYLSNTRITDAGLEHLAQLTDLEELGLDGTRITDVGVANLRPLSNLRRLRIGRTRVTDAGLIHVAGMPNIQRLELDDLPVTDNGIESIQTMSNLSSLDLSGTRISDRALTAISGLSALTELDVQDTAVTPSAIAEFRRTHPRVQVSSGITRTNYSIWSIALTVVYGLAACAICFYGVHRFWLAWLFVRNPEARRAPETLARLAVLPSVTVQLPMFNERHVSERIIEAACALNYPRDRLQIQVLDDSTGESAAISRRCCERLARAGHRVEYHHRRARDGFKGGALAAGLATASGEFVAVFDADFVPARDFLQQTIHHFTDPQVGMVQAEWAHLNRGESLLTEVQAMFLDGHFVVEQTLRSHTGRWFNFNGTAGVWRRRCIEESGGWQHDTLTEDTDLSYRAQLKGWRFLYLPTVQCGGELPSSLTAFLGQQHRWTKGLIQTARKLFPRILVSRAPWRAKVEAWFHLTSPVMYLVMFVVTAIALPALYLATPVSDRQEIALAVGLGTLLLGTFAAATFYLMSQRTQGLPLIKTVLKLPVLMALGIGMSAVNARAVLGGLLGIKSPFVRTPKFGGRRDLDSDHTNQGQHWSMPPGLIELSIGGVLFACLVLSFVRPFTLIGAPFLLLFAAGYSGVGTLRLADRYGAWRTQIQPVSIRWPRPVMSRVAVGAAAATFLVCISATVLAIASPNAASATSGTGESASLGLDLTTARWRVGADSAIQRVYLDRGSLVLDVRLDEKTDQGEIALDLDGALRPLGNSLGSGRSLTFTVQYPSRFTGEFQAFVKDGLGRSEYGSAEFIEGHDARRSVTVSLVPGTRVPPMGYQEPGFDAQSGIRQIGLKISAQSDRVRGPGYRPFRGTIRITKVRIADVDPNTNPEPEVRPVPATCPRPPASPAAFVAASGIDRPWPLGYGFSGPLTDSHKQELERTYSAIARLGFGVTRVYIGDYRTGLVFDFQGKVAGVEPAFLEYLDHLVATANRHGVTVMVSLTDNTLADGRGLDSSEFIREGESSDRFVKNVLTAFVSNLKGRRVIWDVFNEPENVTAIPLREVQRYVDRVLAAGRAADPAARFTVVSRSRSEIIYWQGRGLDLYSHNIFTARSLEESLGEPRTLDAPIMVAEMAPGLVTDAALKALRDCGYSGIGIWGWGTNDKYQWGANDLERVSRRLTTIAQTGR